MKNILNDTPAGALHGRILFASQFCSDHDLRNKTVLDIGCGFGWFELSAFKRDVRTMVAIEKSIKNLKTAKTALDSSNSRLGVGDALCLPFEDNSFNTIISWDVIEHVPKHTESIMFREVFRVLKENGVFYLSTPYSHFFSNLFDPAWWMIGHRHYSIENLVELADKNGFTLQKIEIKGSWWNIAGILNMYCAKWIFRRKPFFEAAVNTRTDREFGNGRGFVNMFVKLKKI